MNRDILKLAFSESSLTEVGRVFQTAIQPLMGHDTAPEEMGISLVEVWRPGHLSEARFDYLASCPDGDLELARQILWEGSRLTRRLAPYARELAASDAVWVLFMLAFALASRGMPSRVAIDNVLREIYQITDDRLCGRDPQRRLDFLRERHLLMDQTGHGSIELTA